MAIEVFEGFDTFSISQVSRRGYTFAAGQFSTMITGRYGVGQALQLNTFSGSAFCKFPVTGRSEYYGGFDFNTSNANITLVTIMNTSGSTITTFGVGSSNTVLTSTFGNSPTFTLFPGQWQNLQWHLVISATVGVLQVYVDGILAINLSSLNTGTVNIGYVELENSYGGNSFDNFWVMNTTGSHSNTWPTGRMTVQATYPNADDSPLQWTPDSGVTHYTRINETVCDDDSSYVYATGVNFQDTFTVGSLNAAYASTAGTITQVHSVMVSAQNKRDASPTKQMQVLAISSGTTANTTTITSPTTYTSTVLQMNDDPHTSAQWATSAVNALKPAIEVIS